MGFQTGLSGLNSAAKQLDVIGSNVANTNTVGFKQSQVQFADVFAGSLAGGGSKVAAAGQQFSQGNISTTSNVLDLAISGNGFFRMSNNGAVSYTRNGQFNLDKDGMIVNSAGMQLTGYLADATGAIAPGAPVPLSVSGLENPPAATQNVAVLLNLDSRAAVHPALPAFSAADSTTYDYTTAVGVYDSLGNVHTMQTYFVKSAANTWDVYATSNDVVPAVTSMGQLTFDTNGNLTAPVPASFNSTYTVGTGAANININVNFTGTLQYGSSFGVNKLGQDGYASGRLAGFNVETDGKIVGRYTNGQTAVLGQVALTNFGNPGGLAVQGGNQWTETAESGTAVVGAPNTGGLGVLQSSAVEDSNVDMTAELVSMITAQRFYQANAQSIKTQDQVLQSLLNMR
ncbi:MAG: flagellar hook protein FlgE [Pseudomonadota bacterium]